MIRASDRPLRRATQLLAGLVLFGLALAALVKADLGLDPWTVFNQGVARHTGLTIGEVTVIGSLLLLVLWIPLRQRPGIGTVANALIVGPVLDLGIAHLPTPGAPLVQVVYMLGGILASAVATGLYVGAGWGPGPRDGIMTGLHARGIPIPLARGGVEVTVLVVGFLLGGTVGIATVLFAVTIGPLVKPALQHLSVGPSRPERPPRGRPGGELVAGEQA